MRKISRISWPAMLLFGAAPWHAMAATPPAKPVYVEGLGRSVDSGLLARSSGGTEVAGIMVLNGTVAGNTVDHAVTGSNMIGNGAFNGAAGVPMVIQNTGNGVLIQNATIINVQFKP
ncbi:MAG: hypothetical protein ACYC0F_16445 [Rhodanobacter sp.]